MIIFHPTLSPDQEIVIQLNQSAGMGVCVCQTVPPDPDTRIIIYYKNIIDIVLLQKDCNDNNRLLLLLERRVGGQCGRSLNIHHVRLVIGSRRMAALQVN